MTRLWRNEFPSSKEQRLQNFMKMAADKLYDGQRCKSRKEVHHCTWSVNKIKMDPE